MIRVQITAAILSLAMGQGQQVTVHTLGGQSFRAKVKEVDLATDLVLLADITGFGQDGPLTSGTTVVYLDDISAITRYERPKS